MLSFLAALGTWPALPITGHWALRGSLGRAGLRELRSHLPGVAYPGVATATGIALWSMPLLLVVELGIYDAAWLGLCGWIAALAGAAGWLASRRRDSPGSGVDFSRWDGALLAGLVLAGVLYLGYPTESILGDKDPGVYANTAAFLARHGHLDVPYPWQGPEERLPTLQIPGFYKAPGRMSPQFSHLFPSWLALASSSFESAGLFRLNGALALAALCCFYAACLGVVTRPYAVVATLFLAFNTSQIWMARITLSEMLAQLFVWAGLATLARAFTLRSPALARWAALFLAMVALTRIDGFLLVPLLLGSHFYTRIGRPSSVSASLWTPFHQVGIPAFAGAAAVYMCCSPQYWSHLQPMVRPIAAAALLALYAILACPPEIGERLRRSLASRAFLTVLTVAILALAAYAWWLRPIEGLDAAWSWVTGSEGSAPHGDHRRNSLINLAAYLSWGVLWAGLLGACWKLWPVVRQKQVEVAPLLWVCAGFSIVYLYDPIVDPHHFWAVRRFVPVVIPGFVLFAAAGTARVLGRLEGRREAAAGAVLIAILTLFSARAAGPMLFFAEDQDVMTQIEAIAGKLPDGEMILWPRHRSTWTWWATPLHVAFDVRIAPLNLDRPKVVQSAHRWLRERHARGEPVYLLYDGDAPPKNWPEMVRMRRFVMRFRRFRPTLEPLPREIVAAEVAVSLYRTKLPHEP